MDGKKLLIKNSVLFGLAPFLPKIISVLLLPVMTNYLTDVDFGISATISAYTLSIGAFSTLGLAVVLQNSFFKHPFYYKVLWRQIYGFLNIWMLIFATFQALLLYYVIPDVAADNKLLIIFLTNFSTVFFGPTALLGNSYYIYSKQPFPVVWRSFLASIITIFSSYILIVYYKYGYIGWYVSSFIGTFFTNITYWSFVRNKLDLKPIYNFKMQTIKKSLFIAIPTIPHYYSIYLLNSSGRVVLDQSNVTQGEIGKLGITQQLGDLFQTGILGLNNAVSPYFMKALKDDNQEIIKKIGTILVYFVFFIAFGVALWSKELFQVLMSNDSLEKAYPYFIIYIMSLSSRPVYLIASAYYFYFEETKKLLSITFLSGIFALIIYILFIPSYGIWAFLIGHFISHFYFCYSAFFFKLIRTKSTINIPVFRIMGFHGCITLLAYFLVDYLLLKLLISLLLIPIMLFLYNKLKHEFKI